MDIKQIMRLTYIFHILNGLFFLNPIWILYLLEKGLSLVLIAAIDVVFWLSIFVFEIPTGFIADRFGRKVSMIVGLIIVSIAFFMLGNSDTLLMILISFVSWGFGVTFISGAAEAFFYDLIKVYGHEKEWAHIYGKLNFVTSLSLAVSSVIGGVLGAISLELPIFLTAFAFLVTILPLLFLPESRVKRNSTHLPPIHNPLQIIFRSRNVKLLIIFQVLFGGLLGVWYFFQQPYLQSYGFSVEVIGFVISIAIVIGALGSSVTGPFKRLTGKFSLFILSFFLAGAIFILGVGSSTIIIIFFFGTSFFKGMYYPLMSTYFNREIPSKHRASILSIASALTTFFIALVEPLMGIIAAEVSVNFTYIVLSLGFAITILPILFLWFKHHRSSQSSGNRSTFYGQT